MIMMTVRALHLMMILLSLVMPMVMMVVMMLMMARVRKVIKRGASADLIARHDSCTNYDEEKGDDVISTGCDDDERWC